MLGKEDNMDEQRIFYTSRSKSDINIYGLDIDPALLSTVILPGLPD